MKYYLISIAILLSSYCLAQIPNGYYNSAEGLTGTQLQATLHNIIDNHNSQSYSSLWDHFEDTDKKSNGKVWCMYSDNPGGTPPYSFNFGSDQCGSYSSESSCYNREHSFPKSWFNEQLPMNTDLFHLYPTDGYVNGQRSNLPYGEVGNASWTSLNGSKKGSCSYPGYSGTVFEPIDDYKGDFARTYFYMATRYYNEDNSWPGSDMTDGAEPKAWARNMLLEWHENDPVSQKEIDRNNEVHDIQYNRNPFIDFPEFAYAIWDSNYQDSEISITDMISIYPNPAKEVINIDIPSNIFSEIKIFNNLGKLVLSEKITSNNLQISSNNFNNGLYIINFEGQSLNHYTKLIIAK